MNYFSRSFLIAFGFLSAVALAAAGDRFINNPNQDADIKVQVNDGGVTKEAIKVTGSTGGVTIGASGETNLHRVNGPLGINTSPSGTHVFQVETPGTGLGVNFRHTAGVTNRPGLWIGTNESTTDVSLEASGSTSTNMVLKNTNIEVFRANSSGAVTLGASGGTQNHTVNGSFQFGTTSNSSYVKRYSVSVSGGTTAQFTLPSGFFGHIYARTDAGSNGGVYFFGGDGNCVPAFGPTTVSGNGTLNRISVCNFTISGFGAGTNASIIIIGGTS